MSCITNRIKQRKNARCVSLHLIGALLHHALQEFHQHIGQEAPRLKQVKMTQREVRLPPEILDRIFACLEREDPTLGWDPIPNICLDKFRPQSSLHPLLFVCKGWSGVSHGRLYRSVGLGGGTHLSKKGEIFREFHRTVEGNPYLAHLVRELSMSVPSGYPQALSVEFRKGSVKQALLLRLCRNVEIVNITGAALPFTALLKVVLPRLDLVELSISFGFDALFWTRSELITLILNWPRLQKLSVTAPDFVDIDDDTILPDPSVLQGRCPDLREFSVEDGDLHAKHLLLLSIIAPNVEKANIEVWNDVEETLGPVLRNWASSLVHFCLTTDDKHHISSTIPNLQKVRYLKVSSFSIPPQAFSGNFSRLETLMYTFRVRQLEVLAEVLKEDSTLPSLRVLEPVLDIDVVHLRTDRERLIPTLSSITNTCQRRQIDFFDELCYTEIDDE